MISPRVLAEGLAMLGEAYGRQVDAVTSKVWSSTLRELNDAQFRYGVDAVLRTRTERQFPPPAVVLAAGFEMPLPAVTLSPSTRALSDGSTVDAAADYIRAHPRGAGEGVSDYLHRVCQGAGLIPEPVTTGSGMVHATTREPGEEG